MAAATLVLPDPQYLELSQRVVQEIIDKNHLTMQLQTLLLVYRHNPEATRQFWIWTTAHGLNSATKVSSLETLATKLQRLIGAAGLGRRLVLFARLGMVLQLQELASQFVGDLNDVRDAVKDAIIFNQRSALEVLLATRRAALSNEFMERMALTAYKLAYYDIYRSLVLAGAEVGYAEFDDVARRDDVETAAAFLDTNKISPQALQQNANEFNSVKIIELLKNRNLYNQRMGSSILTLGQLMSRGDHDWNDAGADW